MNTDPLPQPRSPSTLTAELPKDDLFRVLSLDGGGAKGFYTLGVLKEIEALLKCPLYKRFDLGFGTSTGAIIAALVALGFEVDQRSTRCPCITCSSRYWTSILSPQASRAGSRCSRA